jgi:hypothetical protein
MEDLFCDRAENIGVPPRENAGQRSGSVPHDRAVKELRAEGPARAGKDGIDSSALDIREDFSRDYNRYSRRMELVNGAKFEPLFCYAAPIRKAVGEYKFLIDLGSLAHIHSDVIYPTEAAAKTGALALARNLGATISWGILYE